MSKRARGHVFGAFSGLFAGALVSAGGCGIDDALVGGECAPGYSRCGATCCLATDGPLADDGTMGDGPSGDGYRGDGTPDGYLADGETGTTGDGYGGDVPTDGPVGDGTTGDGGQGSSRDGNIEGAVEGGCAPQQTDCSGVCVDTTASNDNCGRCGNMCPPTELCIGGVCEQPVGNVVYIGSDYTTDAPAEQQRVLTNSVNLAAALSVRVLSYEQYALPAATAQVDQRILAGSQYSFTILTTSTLPADFGAQTYGVLLVHDQASAPAGFLGALGDSWSEALSTFVADGGVLVVLDGGSGTGEMPDFAYQTELLLVTGHAALGSPAPTLVDNKKSDAVSVGLFNTLSFALPEVSLTLDPLEIASPDVDEVITIEQETGIGSPVVVHKTF